MTNGSPGSPRDTNSGGGSRTRSRLARMIADHDSEWDTMTSGYDEHKVYRRSSDSHGHGVEIRFRVPEYYAGLANTLIEQVNGYKSKTDIFIDAFTHRVHQIAQWPDSHINLQPLEFELHQAQIEQQQALEREWRKYTEMVQDRVQDLQRRMLYERALEVLDQASFAAQEMAEDIGTKLALWVTDQIKLIKVLTRDETQ